MAIPEHVIQTIWQRQSFWDRLVWLLLAPLAVTFSALVRSRNFLYDFRLLPRQRPTPKVISVGNLTVGGTGKTPFVLWLAHALQARDYQVGILTRGYKGSQTGTVVVGAQGEALASPAEVGDEAVMLARTFPGVVIAGKNRMAAAQLAHQNFQSDIVIVDDGFQHRQLQRDIDVLLINASHGQRGLGNGWLLPAGPLREPLSATQRTDIVVFTKGRPRLKDWPENLDFDNQKFGHKPVFYADLKPTALVQSVQRTWQELPLVLLAHRRVLAVAGIADPVPFYGMLREQEVELIQVLSFPDHHAYTQADWQTILVASRSCDLVVTTEKDLVKLEQFPFPASKLVALRVRMEIRDADQLLTAIERQLEQTTEKGSYGSTVPH
jgi:tetraacyldisaccharide 4'-kinase